MSMPKWIKGKKKTAIWKTLDSKKGKTTKEIAKQSRVSLTYTYKTIKEFKKRGEAITISKNPCTHIAVR